MTPSDKRREDVAKALSRAKGLNPEMPMAYDGRTVVQRAWELELAYADAAIAASGVEEIERELRNVFPRLKAGAFPRP